MYLQNIIHDLKSTCKDILLVGMSGIGKSWLASQIIREGSWKYRSVDNEIQNSHLREEILSTFRSELDAAPMVKQLDSFGCIKLEPAFQNGSLIPLTSYLGMPGETKRGGLKFNEYLRRQRMHLSAEKKELELLPSLAKLEGEHYLVDTSGSFCEVIDNNEALLTELSKRFLFVSLRENDNMVSTLKSRYQSHPKPIYYQEQQLKLLWEQYQNENQIAEDIVDPNKFSIWSYEKLIDTRRQKYKRIAKSHGRSIVASMLNT